MNFFKKVNIDPAVASGPFITTINDLVAVVSYYGMAWILLIVIATVINYLADRISSRDGRQHERKIAGSDPGLHRRR